MGCLSCEDKAQILKVLDGFTQVRLAIVFGSVATGTANFESDLDIAVSTGIPLTSDEKMSMIGAFAERFGRPVDLIDLKTVGDPLLGQILRHGKMLVGTETLYGDLLNRYLVQQADFAPYRERILAERRKAWIG